MKIRNNLTVWLCEYAIYASAFNYRSEAYGYMFPEATKLYIVNYIKRQQR